MPDKSKSFVVPQSVRAAAKRGLELRKKHGRGGLSAKQAKKEGVGSGVQPQQPSDDPTTTAVDDPTIDVVGNLPLVDAHKTVTIVVDNGSQGIVDPEQVARAITERTALAMPRGERPKWP